MGVFTNPPEGSYRGVAVADPSNLIAELNEANNTGSVPLTITKPDLTVTGLTTAFSAGGKPGTKDVSLQATVANVGTASAVNVQVGFAFSGDGGATFTNIGGPVSAGTIAAGGSAVATTTWRNVSPGTYLVRVTADPGKLISESNEANNSSTFPVTVP